MYVHMPSEFNIKQHTSLRKAGYKASNIHVQLHTDLTTIYYNLTRFLHELTSSQKPVLEYPLIIHITCDSLIILESGYSPIDKVEQGR